MAIWPTRAHPSWGGLPILSQDLFPKSFSLTSGTTHPANFSIPYSSSPILCQGTPPNQGPLLMGAKGRCLFSPFIVIILLFPTLEPTHLLPIQYSYQGLFSNHSSIHGGQSITVPVPRRPPQPNSQITQSSSPSEYLSHQNPLPTGLPSCQSLSPILSLATPRPLLS